VSATTDNESDTAWIEGTRRTLKGLLAHTERNTPEDAASSNPPDLRADSAGGKGGIDDKVIDEPGNNRAAVSTEVPSVGGKCDNSAIKSPPEPLSAATTETKLQPKTAEKAIGVSSQADSMGLTARSDALSSSGSFPIVSESSIDLGSHAAIEVEDDDDGDDFEPFTSAPEKPSKIPPNSIVSDGNTNQSKPGTKDDGDNRWAQLGGGLAIVGAAVVGGVALAMRGHQGDERPEAERRRLSRKDSSPKPKPKPPHDHSRGSPKPKPPHHPHGGPKPKPHHHHEKESEWESM